MVEVKKVHRVSATADEARCWAAHVLSLDINEDSAAGLGHGSPRVAKGIQLVARVLQGFLNLVRIDHLNAPASGVAVHLAPPHQVFFCSG
jgi:hypothetical protein